MSAPQPQQQQQLPHDIRSILPYRPTLADYAPWIGGGVLILIAAAALVYFWRKRRPKTAPVVIIDPWEQIFNKLAGLSMASPFVGAALVEFFYQLSLLLREAIEQRTGIGATDKTLNELRGPLRKQLPLGPEQIEAILTFLERSDMVKFAGFTATADEAQRAKEQVAAWARALKPLATVTAHLEQREAQA